GRVGFRVSKNTRRAPPYGLSSARACVSHRIDQDHPHDPDKLSLRQNRPSPARVSVTWSLLDVSPNVPLGLATGRPRELWQHPCGGQRADVLLWLGSGFPGADDGGSLLRQSRHRLPHIYDHGVTEAEVQRVLNRPGEDGPSSDGSRQALGQSEGGRYLRMVYVPDEDGEGVFMVTAYRLAGRELKAYRRRKRRRGR